MRLVTLCLVLLALLLPLVGCCGPRAMVWQPLPQFVEQPTPGLGYSETVTTTVPLVRGAPMAAPCAPAFAAPCAPPAPQYTPAFQYQPPAAAGTPCP